MKKERPPGAQDEAIKEAEAAYDYLELQRGYTLTKNSNWLPPKNIEEPTKADIEAALLLGHVFNYGGIVRLLRCPFCGGRADATSPIGVECEDCGGSAADVECWQRRSA